MNTWIGLLLLATTCGPTTLTPIGWDPKNQALILLQSSEGKARSEGGYLFDAPVVLWPGISR